jgi:hypothetical protein
VPRHLKLSESPHSRVYRELVAILKADGALKGAIKTWKVGDGEPRDAQAEPSVGNAPFLELSPVSQAMDWRDERSHRSPLAVQVTLTVPGTCYLDGFDLWHAVVKAVFPDDNAAREAIRLRLRQAGAIVGGTTSFTRPAFAEGQGPGGPFLSAVGTLAIEIPVET